MPSIEEKRPRIRVALAIVHDGKLLLVEHTKASKSYWLLPGGGLEWGEGLHEAAAREVAEETGLEVAPGELLLVSETLSPCGEKHVIHLVFEARLLAGDIVVPNEEERITDVRWFKLNEVEGLTLHPPIQRTLAKLESNTVKRGQDREVFLGNLWVD